MSFTSEINTIMNADASINALVDIIRYENLPSEWLTETVNNKWIVFGINKQDQFDCLGAKNVYTNYTLSIVAIQRHTNNELDTISNRLITYLNDISTDNIIDINFNSDQGGFDEQQQIYTNTLEFIASYVG